MTSTAADGSSSLALPVLDDELEGRLRGRLALVEERLEREIRSEAAFVTEAARHLMHAGGKRFRPALTLLAAVRRYGAAIPGVTSLAGRTARQ